MLAARGPRPRPRRCARRAPATHSAVTAAPCAPPALRGNIALTASRARAAFLSSPPASIRSDRTRPPDGRASHPGPRDTASERRRTACPTCPTFVYRYTASANSRLVDNKEVFSIRFCSPPKRPHEGSVEAPLTSQAVAVVDPDQIPTCKQRNGFLHMVGLPSLQRCLIARMEQR